MHQRCFPIKDSFRFKVCALSLRYQIFSAKYSRVKPEGISSCCRDLRAGRKFPTMITLLPDLPPDVSENILQSLTCKDVCNLAQSCKAFWALTCQQQSIEFRAGSDLSVLSKAKSLSRYLQNRGARGLQVCVHASLASTRVVNFLSSLSFPRTIVLFGLIDDIISITWSTGAELVYRFGRETQCSSLYSSC